MKQIISVIVPVYNVEQYLNRCLESIVSQTFRELEIILVDDGSPDRCGKICDMWADKDPRITVIHKENSGVSEARNTGIRASHGKYIAFVDSDDWIAPDMMENMYRLIEQNNCDMAICQFYWVSKDGEMRRNPSRLENRILSPNEALQYLIGDSDITNHAWRRLYLRELFSDIEFPAGVIFEDALIMAELTYKCRRIIYLNEVYYYYFQNAEGLVSTPSDSSVVEYCEAILHQHRFVLEHAPNLLTALYPLFIAHDESLLDRLRKLPRGMIARRRLVHVIAEELKTIPDAHKYHIGTARKLYCYFAKKSYLLFYCYWIAVPALLAVHHTLRGLLFKSR